MIQIINYFITRFFDILLYPFGFIPEFWGILFLSVLMSFFVLVMYKYISSPRGIKEAKDKIKAHILAIRLYKDFWKVNAVSFFKSLFYIFKYFTLNMVPLLVIIPILFPAFVQMDIRYGMRAFKPGEEVVIKARFAEDPNLLQVRLLENGSLKPAMNPVFINGFADNDGKEPIKEVNWKIRAAGVDLSQFQLDVNGRIFEKSPVSFGRIIDRRTCIGGYIHPVPGEKYTLPWH